LKGGLAHLNELDRIAVRGIRYLGRTSLGVRFYLLPATIRDLWLCDPQTPAVQRLERTVEPRTHAFGVALAVIKERHQHQALLYDQGASYQDVAANRAVAMFDAPGNRTATLAGLVPDGVRAVQIAYASKTVTIRVPVGHNFWAAQVPAMRVGLEFRFLWLGSKRRVFGRFAGIHEAAY